MPLTDAFCSHCDLDRSDDPELDATTRTLCPACGKTSSIIYKRGFTAVVSATASVDYVMTPGDQSRDLPQRWRTVQSQLTLLEQPRSGGVSAAAIEAAEVELVGWFIEANHLRDVLIDDGLLTKSQMSSILRATPALGLMADLANVRKHVKLTLRSWTGHQPKLSRRAGASVPGGWQLRLTIKHNGTELDALDVARQACDAWEQLLTSRGWV